MIGVVTRSWAGRAGASFSAGESGILRPPKYPAERICGPQNIIFRQGGSVAHTASYSVGCAFRSRG